MILTPFRFQTIKARARQAHANYYNHLVAASRMATDNCAWPDTHLKPCDCKARAEANAVR